MITHQILRIRSEADIAWSNRTLLSNRIDWSIVVALTSDAGEPFTSNEIAVASESKRFIILLH